MPRDPFAFPKITDGIYGGVQWDDAQLLPPPASAPILGLRQRQFYLSPGAGSEHPQNGPSQVSASSLGCVAIVRESS